MYDADELHAFRTTLETKKYKPAFTPPPTKPDSDTAPLSKFVEVWLPHFLFEGLDPLVDALKAIRENLEVARLSVPIHYKRL